MQFFLDNIRFRYPTFSKAKNLSLSDDVQVDVVFTALPMPPHVKAVFEVGLTLDIVRREGSLNPSYHQERSLA